MDEVKRQAQEHQVWEMEWESAFNIQIRIQEVLTLTQLWAYSDVCYPFSFSRSGGYFRRRCIAD